MFYLYRLIFMQVKIIFIWKDSFWSRATRERRNDLNENDSASQPSELEFITLAVWRLKPLPAKMVYAHYLVRLFLQKNVYEYNSHPLLIFASNSSKGQILRALSNWMAPFDTPFICWLSSSVGVVLICFLNTLPQARNKANKILDRLNIFFKLCSLLPYQLCKCHNICRWTFLGSYNKVHPPPSTSLHLDRDNSHRDHLIH